GWNAGQVGIESPRGGDDGGDETGRMPLCKQMREIGRRQLVALDAADWLHNVSVVVGKETVVELGDIEGYDVVLNPIVQDFDTFRVVGSWRELEVEAAEQALGQLWIGLRRRCRLGRPVGAGLRLNHGRRAGSTPSKPYLSTGDLER